MESTPGVPGGYKDLERVAFSLAQLSVYRLFSSSQVPGVTAKEAVIAVLEIKDWLLSLCDTVQYVGYVCNLADQLDGNVPHCVSKY